LLEAIKYGITKELTAPIIKPFNKVSKPLYQLSYNAILIFLAAILLVMLLKI
jgi:hypothetical protein